MIRHILYVNLLAVSAIGFLHTNEMKATRKLIDCGVDYSLDSESSPETENDAADMSNTSSTSTTTYNDFKTAYFDNLTYNFGKNYQASCGYVAMGELLSYYDTCWNDDIIDEKYDIVSTGSDKNIVDRHNSPGTLKDVNTDCSESYMKSLTPSAYYEYVKANSERSFHAYLITLGNRLGYYDFNSVDHSPCATGFYSRKDILTAYLNSKGLKYTFNSYNGQSDFSLSNKVRKFTINEITKGNPVLLSIHNLSINEGHVAIAYDYDSEKDEIYCNMGWSASSTHLAPESEGYTIYKSALTLAFEGEHSHSDNYQVVTTSGGVTTTQSYCYDSTDVCVYKHDHAHSYLNYSATYHKAFCACGQYELKPHQIDRTTETKIGTHVYAFCKDCRRRFDMTSDSGMLASIKLGMEAI